MIDRIIAIYCICDDFFKNRNWTEWHNIKMTDAEIMTVFIVACLEFYGNVEKARQFMYEHHYMRRMVEKSRFFRRIHRFNSSLLEQLIQFALLRGQAIGLTNEFLVDSFPVRVCHNIRINRARIFAGVEYRGYIASKKEYFRGLKIHLITTANGRPVFAWLTPGKMHDLSAFREKRAWSMLPEGSKVYSDAAYLDYELESEIESENRRLIARRRGNSKRPLHVRDYLDLIGLRGMIETTFSRIASMMARKIHAVTETGIQIKAMGLVAALSILLAISPKG
jgi:hypothetical protein